MNMHSHLTDEQRKIKAMYHLEVCFESGREVEGKPREEIDAHITAAHYLVQSMAGGYTPDNYDEVMRRAMEFEAADEANAAIHIAKQSK